MTERRRYQREYFNTELEGMTMRIGFNTVRGYVTAFTVQLECWLDGEWRPVVRYDTAHSRAHRDTLDWDRRVKEKMWLPAGIAYNVAMNDAIADLQKNATTYRDEFVRSKPR